MNACDDIGRGAEGGGAVSADARHAEAGTPGTGTTAVEVSGLTFTYPGADAPVLRDASLKLPQGAFALLVGSTGSGKSTLLSLLKPEISPAGERSGSLRVFGRPLAQLDAEESARGIGFVFQSPDNQLVCESVWHEMAFGLENLGTPQAEMRRLVAETSYFFGLEDWFRHDTDTLSGGRKQLLALASTLVMQPRLLLLDEPTAQLDPIAEKNFLHALFRVNRELGCTVIVATHAPRAMVDYATCAFRLEDGTLHEVADLDELRARPCLVDEGAEGSEVVGGMSSGAESNGVASSAATGGESRASAGRAGGAVPAAAESVIPAVASTRDDAPAVELSRAWFRYDRDGDWVLRNLDLRIRPGRIHALVGGNGCGKSTLLAVIAGIRKLQKGSLRLDPALQRSRALLPQDPKALFAEETAEAELMEWSRGSYGVREAHAMRDRLGLSGCASLHPYDLSGGQQQLLALGKLLLTRPRLLLLDEPTKGLDLASRRTCARVLDELCDEGVSVVLATHDLDFVEQAAHDVSMVFDGEIACTDPAAEFFRGNVYYRP